MLKRYWIRFERFNIQTPLNLGCGVTAFNAEDAKRIVEIKIKNSDIHVDIASIELISNIADLDKNHVIPNMGNIFERGIWFPQGY